MSFTLLSYVLSRKQYHLFYVQSGIEETTERNLWGFGEPDLIEPSTNPQPILNQSRIISGNNTEKYEFYNELLFVVRKQKSCNLILGSIVIPAEKMNRNHFEFHPD